MKWILLCGLLCVSSLRLSGQKEIKITFDVPYRSGSKACVLDIAQPVDGTTDMRPAIVFIHGGAWSAGSKSDPVFREQMIEYAQKGYVTLSVEYRFNQETAFPACIQDVKCAIRWLKAHAEEFRVDTARIGCTGHSAGGHLALMMAVSSDNPDLEGDGPWREYSSKVACAVGGAPPTEIGNPNIPWSKHPEWWPIGYIKAGQPPLLLLQGDKDPLVKPHLTDDYVSKMRKAGSNVDYIRIEGNHDVAYNKGLEFTRPATEAFFARHLKNDRPEQQIVKVKVSENGGSGKYKAFAVTEKSLPDYVVYRPVDMNRAVHRGGKLPVVVYANGGCMNTSVHVEKMLTEMASHGYIVIAIGEMQNYPHDRREQHTPSSMLVGAMNWIEERNADSTSIYYNKVDVDKIAAAGHSCGGAQVLAVANDSRIKTYVIMNAGMGDMEMAGASKKSLKQLHAPIIYMTGGKGDVAYPNARKDYAAIKKVPVVFADMPRAGHGATFSQPCGGDFARMAVRWLDWQLKGHEQNSGVFLEADLKDFPEWTMESKNFKK